MCLESTEVCIQFLSDIRCPIPDINHQHSDNADDLSVSVHFPSDHYNAVIILRCDAGFSFDDGTAQRTVTCNESGMWSVQQTNCIGTNQSYLLDMYSCV